MFKRAITMGLLGVGVVVALDSPAHLAGTKYIGSPPTPIHYKSLLCNLFIKSVPSPDVKPSQFQCTATVHLVQVLCLNPSGHETKGEAATQVAIVATSEINNGDITDKKKGIAFKELDIPDDPLLDPEFCVNPNWTPIKALAVELTAELEVAECTGPDSDPCSVTVPTWIETHDCVLPPGFDIQDNPPPPGTPATCFLISKEHLK